MEMSHIYKHLTKNDNNEVSCATLRDLFCNYHKPKKIF